MDGIDLGFGRDSSGRFVPGVSGNPAGKKPGTRNRKTVLMEALRDGEDIAVARVVIDKALAGDAVAARFCLGLLSPKPRGRAIALDLSEDARAGDVVAAFDATLAAMACGDITPDEALIITRVLDGRRRALETLALERRVDAADEGEAVTPPLQSTCISRPPAAMPNPAARLPRHERRRFAALAGAAEARPWRRRWARSSDPACNPPANIDEGSRSGADLSGPAALFLSRRAGA
jgi:hypothetical protein